MFESGKLVDRIGERAEPGEAEQATYQRQNQILARKENKLEQLMMRLLASVTYYLANTVLQNEIDPWKEIAMNNAGCGTRS